MKILLDRILTEMETFLENWAMYMRGAGYLEHTTAKREDCILSIQGVVFPIRQHLSEKIPLDFASILKNSRNIADSVLMTAQRHKSRGISAEMFFGCFKTLIHSVEDIILGMDADDSTKLKGYIELRRIFDAMETIVINDWNSQDGSEYISVLAEKNRALTLDKNKYENIFEVTSDIAIVINAEGTVLELNKAATEQFKGDIVGENILKYIGLSEYSIDEFLKAFPYGEQHEIRVPEISAIYSMVVVPLKKVSLASAGYVIILNDITCMVDQRLKLEAVVAERTEALTKSEKIFRSLFTSAGEGIMLADAELNVVQANQKAADMYGLTTATLEGVSCIMITHPASIDSLRLAASIKEGEVWHGEINSITKSGDIFPASVTVNKFKLGGKDFLHIIVRNITQQKSMEEYLKQEKTKAEEMNVTLRNVMKAIDKEKEELELSISQKVLTTIIPSVQKLAGESNSEIRQMYLNIVRDQLSGLTKSTGSMNNEDIMKLTKSEIQVCQMIQSGSSSKDIAETMNISFETVQTHRKNIRKKLGLSGKDVNLFAYLNK
ncbi:MAG: PAS domain S-box protein [Deferribacterales bacterium]